MEALLKRYNQLYSRARDQVDKWSNARARLLAILTSATAIIARLPVIEDRRNYGACFSRDLYGSDASSEVLSGDALKRALVGKQVESLESALKAMNGAVQDMWEVSGTLTRLAQEGEWAWERSKPRPNPSQLTKRWGLQPSIADCVEGLSTLAEMHRDEINLKLAVLGAISYNTSEEDLAAVQAVLEDEPNIPPHLVTEIFHKVALNL